MNFNPLHIIRDRNERAILMICIGIAFIIWFATKMSKTYEMDTKVKVTFQPPSEGDIVTKEPPKDIEVRLNGKGWDLMYQSLRRQATLTYDLSKDTLQEFRQGQLTRDIQNNVRKDIAINNIIPEYIPLVLDRKVQKRIPIAINENISIAPQYLQMAPIIIRPDTIQVIGPSTIVRNLKEWKTLPLKVNNLSSRQTNMIKLDKHPNSQVIFTPQVVTYDIIVEQLTEREIEIPIEIIGKTDSISIYPNKIKAKCTMGLSHYERLHPSQFRLVVDVSNLGSNQLPIIKQTEPKFLQTIQYSADSVSYLVLKYQ